jgi:hypothetical protein
VLISRGAGDASRAILIDGMIKLCEDLGVDPSDSALLVLSWKCEAAHTCRFTESEFTEGMAKLGVDAIDQLKKALPSLRKELDNPDSHKEIYQFACVALTLLTILDLFPSFIPLPPPPPPSLPPSLHLSLFLPTFGKSIGIQFVFVTQALSLLARFVSLFISSLPSVDKTQPALCFPQPYASPTHSTL